MLKIHCPTIFWKVKVPGEPEFSVKIIVMGSLSVNSFLQFSGFSGFSTQRKQGNDF